LRYANCGHLAPLILRRDNTFQRLESTSTVLGLFEEWNCSLEEQQLFSGDTVAFYTDGITESSRYRRGVRRAAPARSAAAAS
jgi:serine phosphatase RsbU (regulator of sigma subunit)